MILSSFVSIAASTGDGIHPVVRIARECLEDNQGCGKNESRASCEVSG